MLTNLLRASTAAIVGLAIFHGSVSQANAAPPPAPGRPGGLTPSFATYWPNGYPHHLRWRWGWGWPGYGYGYYYPGYDAAAYYTALGNLQAQQSAAIVLQARARQELVALQRQAAVYSTPRSTPTPEVATSAAAGRLTIAQGNPALKDIRSGQALNELLVDLQKHGDAGFDTALDQKALAKINVTSGPGRDQAIFNFLQEERTAWPAFLQGEQFASERASLTQLAAEAIDEVMGGSQAPAASKELRRKLEELYERLDSLDAGDERQWMEARGFVRRYSSAARALQQPDAREYLSGAFKPRASTVGELVNHMTKHGLRFAADAGDNQLAYRVIHRALADTSVAVHGYHVAAR